MKLVAILAGIHSPSLPNAHPTPQYLIGNLACISPPIPCAVSAQLLGFAESFQSLSVSSQLWRPSEVLTQTCSQALP